VWRQAHVETAHFYTNKQVDHLIKETEVHYTLGFIDIFTLAVTDDIMVKPFNAYLVDHRCDF